MAKMLEKLLEPAFLMGYTSLIAVIAAMFVFAADKDVTMALITVLTNVLTGAITFYYTKHQVKTTKDKEIELLLEQSIQSKTYGGGDLK